MSKSDEQVIAPTNAAEWQAWLARYANEASGVWLMIAKAGSGQVSVSLSDALDVALCHGWIDSTRRRHDEVFYLQRYSPRRARSPWSKLNVDRAEALVAAGRMQAAGLREIEAAKADGRWDAAYAPQRDFSVPADFEETLMQNPAAAKAFARLDKSGQYAVVLPVLKASSPEQRVLRLGKALAALEAAARASSD
ncbi:MAG: YdeI/OmpD-associated family protein [Moraxellaceae bacterium]|nr:YdeI/OmpD-associated family protein [Moraxellaceae bacterium]